jgi:hypothetical protein
MSALLPEVEYVCRWTPSTCMDDLCRNSSVGICGNVDLPDDDEDDEAYWDAHDEMAYFDERGSR